MLPPAAVSFSALVASVAFLFTIWHTYHYDRWRQVDSGHLYTKLDWFRALMCQILLLSVASFAVYTWMEVYVLYDEYYVFLGGATIPAPWQLWSEENQKLWSISLYLLCTGWCFMQAVHLEEFLYWGYLIHGIKTSGGPRTAWIHSSFFKVWVGASMSTTALLFGASHIETENLDMMRAYLYTIGSALSCLLAGASIVLCCILPKFVEAVKSQGATFEVMERLHFFAEMNSIRTVFRCLYSISFLILSADGLSPNKTVNKTDFWADLLYICGILASTCLSVLVLLPRNMNAESLPLKSEENLHPMVAYKRPMMPSRSSDTSSPLQLYEMGDRLNIERDAFGSGLLSPGYELRHSPGVGEAAVGNKEADDGSEGSDRGVPFGVAIDRKRARFAEHDGDSRRGSLPAVMAKFKGPFETAQPEPRVPTKVYVTTTRTVHED